jgi:hypothetical protein
MSRSQQMTWSLFVDQFSRVGCNIAGVLKRFSISGLPLWHSRTCLYFCPSLEQKRQQQHHIFIIEKGPVRVQARKDTSLYEKAVCFTIVVLNLVAKLSRTNLVPRTYRD